MPKTAAELITAAMGAGLTRAQIARMAGCTRMHVWRVQRQKVKNTSQIAKRLISALGRFDMDEQEKGRLQTEVMGEIERIVRKDPLRSKLVLEMIRLAQQISE